MSEEINPYLPSPMASSESIAPLEDDWEAGKFRVGRSIACWAFICTVSAIPSFLIAIGMVPPENWFAIVLGVFVFICGYVALDYRTHRWSFRRKRSVRFSLMTTYSLRMLVTIIYPVGMFLDLICGTVSALVVAPFQGAYKSYPEAAVDSAPLVFLWTVSQGVVMHFVLFVAWIPIWLLLALIIRVDATE